MENTTNYNKVLAYLAGGICFLYLLISKIYLGDVLEFFTGGSIPQKAIHYLFIYYSILSVGFVVAIIFLLKRKRWSLWLLQGLCAVVFITVIKQLVLISYSSFVGIGLIVLFALVYFTIPFCAKKDIKLEFGAKIKEKRKKLLSAKWGMGLLIILVGGLFGYYSFHYYIVFPKKRVIKAYNWSSSEMEKVKDYEILNYSIKLPRDLKMESNESGKYLAEDQITLTNEDESIRVVLNLDPFNPMYSVLGYNNSYELTRRISRLSRIFLQFTDEELVMDEVTANDVLDGFFVTYKSDKYKVGQMYQLYDKRNRNIDGQIMITDKNGVFTEKQWEGLIHGLTLK